MSRLTILTPLYNRREYLDRIFKSLSAQTNKDFQWLVIDDGSCIPSFDQFYEYSLKSEFEIEYHYKENGGKHTALNYSHPYIKGEYLLILDSDDYLTCDAVDIILGEWEKYESDDNIAVVSLLKCFEDEKLIAEYPTECVSDHISFRININILGDCCEVVRSSVFKDFEFPVFEGETFLDEMHLWYGIGRKYKTAYVNRAVYVAEYLEDGLSGNVKSLYMRNPLGSIHSQLTALSCNLNLKNRLKRSILLIVYGKAAEKGFWEVLKLSPAKLMTLALWAPSSLLYVVWKKKY